MFAYSSGAKVHYLKFGKGKKNLVLVMGLGIDHRGWIMQIPYFKEKYNVIAIDNRGVGKTEYEGEFSTEDMAEDIKSVLDKEGVEKAIIIGASMGGMISQKFASKYPEMVEKLVLVCTLPKVEEHEGKIIREGAKFLKGIELQNEEEIKKNISAFLDISPERIFNFLSKYIFTKSFLEKNYDFIISFFKDYLKDGFSISGFFHQILAILNHNSFPDLPKISSKTLIISGDEDKMVPPQKSEILHREIKNSVLKFIKGGSHAFMLEMPDQFNKEVEKFIEN